MTQDLDHLLKEIWPIIRKRHHYPELPAPQWSYGEERVAMEIKGKHIYLSRPFVAVMAEVLDPGEVLEALLDHAVSHYLYCPWDFSTHLRLYQEAKKVLKDKEMARKATDSFIDVVADTHCISQMESALPKLYGQLKRGVWDEAIHALYQKIWGIDLGVQGHEEITVKLSRLPYLDRKRWASSMRRFARDVQPLFKLEKNLGGSPGHNPMGGHSLQKYSSEEIEQGLREFAQDAASPSKFKEIVEDMREELLAANQNTAQGMGRGSGMSTQADILYYMKLAEGFSLPIQKKPMEKSGCLYPYQHLPWEIGRPFQDIDPWTSFGKIMPGITQMWERREMEISGKEEGIPDCIVLIDSSGSMPNPTERLSYAVLGAACACDAYLKNGAQVAVYNFSDAKAGGRAILPYSRHRKEIYRLLCTYFGGGTNLPMKEIDSLLADRGADIFLITDMQITNLEILTQYFSQCPNRVTAVHIGTNEHVQNFRRSIALRKNVGVYAVEKKEDIPRIVLGRIREYFHTEPSAAIH
ncbi:MAG: hypothetical protein ABSG91_09695 [Syntrophobacteraceae bacterium]|jgi:hypothetical protein